MADPFVLEGEDLAAAAIARWYALVRKMAPLWCLDRWAFKALRSDDLPSAYPISRLIRRIVKDEGLNQYGAKNEAPPLVTHLVARRIALAEDKIRARHLVAGEEPDEEIVSGDPVRDLGYLSIVNPTPLVLLHDGGDAARVAE